MEELANIKGLIYLATPYTHTDKAVQEQRYYVVNAVAAKLMSSGLYIFSPISHTHVIAVDHELPTTWEYWAGLCRATLEACKAIIVLRQEGWEKSVGVAAETAIAEELGLPVFYLDP